MGNSLLYQQYFMGFTSGEELQNAIETCKEKIASMPTTSVERKHLVKKLVQLRYKLYEQKVSYRYLICAGLLFLLVFMDSTHSSTVETYRQACIMFKPAWD